jgi:23S rRNA pseudouridine2605 synthase
MKNPRTPPRRTPAEKPPPSPATTEPVEGEGLEEQPAEGERVQKLLARAGLGSRRACEVLIREGRVKVNGRVAELGARVIPERDTVEVDGARVPLDPQLRYFALHKPAGVVTTARDQAGRPDVSAYYPPGERVFPVGRLDRETEGLLLLTNDGELANKLMHPRYQVEKEYLAEVEGTPTPQVVGKLVRGVELDDGVARARAASPVAGSKGRSAVRIVMTEGRKREVRRMLEALGLPVKRLVRVRVGPIRLGKLRAGELRELDPAEVRELMKT